MCRPLFFLLIGLFLYSCTGNTLYHSYQSLPAEGWDRSDTIRFDVPETRRGINGSLFIGLRTVAHIGFRDIVLAVEQYDDAGMVCRCDTIRYPLTDEEGNALTKGVNTRQYETQQLPLRIRKGQSGSIRIHHLMRREMISGITEVGIRIEEENR